MKCVRKEINGPGCWRYYGIETIQTYESQDIATQEVMDTVFHHLIYKIRSAIPSMWNQIYAMH
jgi:hypothetical protein